MGPTRDGAVDRLSQLDALIDAGLGDIPTAHLLLLDDLYRSGMGISEIAEKTGLHKNAVWKRLKKMGTPMRQKSGRIWCIRCGRRVWRGYRCRFHWLTEDAARKARNTRNLRLRAKRGAQPSSPAMDVS